MTFLDIETPLDARTNDDFSIDVALPYPIGNSIPIFKLKTLSGIELDYSNSIYIDGESSFKIIIKADNVIILVNELFGGNQNEGFKEIQCDYNVYMNYGDGSKDFLFGGILTIQEGII